jgi:NNP family nitrate/nitrite transporter-like MFS transporter
MKGRGTALILATLALVVSFTAWGGIAPLAPMFRRVYGLSTSQVGLLVAAPVLVGGLGRIPLGLLADRFGGRKVFTALLVALLVPVALVALTRSWVSLLGAGLLLGLAGTSFAVGIPFVAQWFPPERRGLALGIYGMGNMGTAVAGFVAPRIADALGWQVFFWLLLPLIALTAICFWFLGRDAVAPKPVGQSLAARFHVFRARPVSWILALFYFVTFGGYVAFGSYLPTFLVGEFLLDFRSAAARAAGFMALATLARPLGGLLADRWGGAGLLNGAFAGIAVLAIVLAFEPGIVLATVAFLSIALLLGLGNGAVFKLVADLFPREAGTVTGVVGAAGALGGFFPPLVMGLVKDATGSYGIAFMLLSEFALACVVINLLVLQRHAGRLWGTD